MTSGSFSPRMFSCLGPDSLSLLLRKEWPPWPELGKCTYPTVTMETKKNHSLLGSSESAPVGQQSHTPAVPTG